MPSAKPEAEPVSIDIATAFTVFPRTFYSMMVLESNLFPFHQQKLSQRNHARQHLVSIKLEALAYKSAYLVDTKRCLFST